MRKLGLDQITAWILAPLLTGMSFGAVYLLTLLAPQTSALTETEHTGDATVADMRATRASADLPAKDAQVRGGEGRLSMTSSEGAVPVSQDGGVPWGYAAGSSGPEHWGELADDFVLCKTGKRQSPIDITAPRADAKALPISFFYKRGEATVKNTGHTIQADVARGSFIEIDGDRYDLLELHFHAPSEHKITGLGYDLEMHLTHRNTEGRLVVIAVLFEEGVESGALRELWARLPLDKGQAEAPVSFDPVSLLPKSRTYYSYEGSLAEPPCTENVRWYVLTQAVGINASQVDLFASIIGFNARPVQALHGRRVSRSSR